MRTKLIFATLVAVLLLLPLQAVEWMVPLQVNNGIGNSDLLSFGIHPQATDGLDAELGETNLPPLPPLAIFEARFLIDGYEGFELDLRNSNQEEINYNIFWQAGAGGYPVTVNWEPDELPPGDFFISDVFDGYFTGIINMNETGQIIIDASQSFITQMQITANPQQEGDIPPELDLPQYLRIYAGQRVPWLYLEEYVSDYDNLFNELSWEIESESFISCEIDSDILRISYPENWTGSSAIQVTVNDPNENSDSSEILLEVNAGTVFNWEIDLHIAENELLRETLTFGINEGATSGIDPELQEINLPPIPPAGQFDTRFIFPDGDSSMRDIRFSSDEQRIHHIYIQPVNSSSDCLLSWDQNLPPGEFILQDGAGGFFFADQDMSITDDLIIPAGVNDIYIAVTPVIDTEAPVAPQNLNFSAYDGEYLTLNWEPAIDDNFHYYEIYLDSVYFENAGQFIFDFNNATNLTSMATESFEFAAMENVENYYCRIRAWDLFGNVSPLSNICHIDIIGSFGMDLPDEFEFQEDNVLTLNFGEYIDLDAGESAELNYLPTENILLNIEGFSVELSAVENWFGIETVTFTLLNLQSSEIITDSVVVIVDPVNDPPVIELPEILSFDYGDTLSIDLSEYSSDVEEDILGFYVNSGSLEYSQDGSLLNIWSSGFWTGCDTITVTVDDLLRDTDSDDVIICCLPLSSFFGDVDTSEIIDAFDAALVLRFSVGIDPGTAAPFPWENWRIDRADVDGNEIIDAYDAALILQYVCEIITQFPCLEGGRRE